MPCPPARGRARRSSGTGVGDRRGRRGRSGRRGRGTGGQGRDRRTGRGKGVWDKSHHATTPVRYYTHPLPCAASGTTEGIWNKRICLTGTIGSRFCVGFGVRPRSNFAPKFARAKRHLAIPYPRRFASAEELKSLNGCFYVCARQANANKSRARGVPISW